MTNPKFKIGQKVIVSIPRGDFDYKFDGKIGIIHKINELSPEPEYNLEFNNKTKTGLHFLERDLEEYSDKAIIERTIGLKCPECGKGVMQVFPCQNDKKDVKVVIFECLFSATFDLEDNLKEMQEKLDDAEKVGKLKEFGIK